jgi:hypothetical protein
VAARQENAAKLPLKAQTGWSFQTYHPVRAYQRMPSAIIFDGTAPPILRGDYRSRDRDTRWDVFRYLRERATRIVVNHNEAGTTRGRRRFKDSLKPYIYFPNGTIREERQLSQM